VTPQDIKTLMALAKACRKIGIKSFKSADYEFTLGDYTPAKRARPTAKRLQAVPQDMINNLTEDDVSAEELSEEAKLFWSSDGYAATNEDQGVS